MHKTMVGGGAFDAPFRWTKTYFMAIIHRFGTSWRRPLRHLWRFADYSSKCDSPFCIILRYIVRHDENKKKPGDITPNNITIIPHFYPVCQGACSSQRRISPYYTNAKYKLCTKLHLAKTKNVWYNIITRKEGTDQ